MSTLVACSDEQAGAGGQGTDVSSDINRQRPEPDAPPETGADAGSDVEDVATGDPAIEAGEGDPEPDAGDDAPPDATPDAVADVPAEDLPPDGSADLPVDDVPEADGPLPPFAIAGDDFGGRAAAPVQLDGSASYDPDGALVEWQWIFGDGTEDDGATVFHTYAAPGIYVAELTVVDDDGLTAKDTVTIAIGPANQPPVAVIEGPHDVVENESDDFDGRDSTDDGTIVSYTWDVDVDGVDPISGSTLDYAWLAWGEYTLSLTIEDDLGATDTATREITVMARPIAVIDAVTTTTVGTEVTFDGADSSDPDGTVEAWLWEFPDGSTQTTPVAQFTLTVAGEPEVVLTVTDDDGLESSATHKIGVTGGGSTSDMTGIWELDPDPDSAESWSRITYECAIGLISLSFDAFEIQQTGANLAACQEPTGMPCAATSVQPGRLTGTRDVDDTFELDNLYPGGPGGCDEIYTLEGELVGADEFRGTFRAEFTGSLCAAAECTPQEWSVRGLR